VLYAMVLSDIAASKVSGAAASAASPQPTWHGENAVATVIGLHPVQSVLKSLMWSADPPAVGPRRNPSSASVMTRRSIMDSAVIVADAGPSGMVLAGELRFAGVK
jgi:hypothetical protein